MEKFCGKCKKTKSHSEFNKNKSRKDGLQGRCRECQKLTDRDSYKNNPNRKKSIERSNKKLIDKTHQWIGDYLSSHPCVHCGETDILVLQFDHLRDKEFSIGSCYNYYPLVRIKKEISKCRVLCANCHVRHTQIQNNSWKLYYSPV